MTENDRHEVICFCARAIYNDCGDIQSAVVDNSDVDEFHEYCKRCCRENNMREPTWGEVYTAVTEVLGAKWSDVRY